jgi:fucose 4-O-acetylase-like acetyltransferase
MLLLCKDCRNIKVLQNNNGKSATRRFTWIDVAKGVAIVLVIYRHVLIGIQRSGITIETYLLELNEMVYSFRMPLFFILSGFFFAKSFRKRSRKEFLNTKVKSLIYPYLVWALIQVSLQILLNQYTNSNRGLKDYAYIFIQPRAIDQLWFLYAMFNVTVFVFFLKYVIRIPQLPLIGLCIFTFWASTLVKEYSLIHDLLFFPIFFIIGDSLANKILDEKIQQQFSSNKALLLMLPVFLLSQWYWLNHPDINVFLFGLVALFGSFFTIACSIRFSSYRFSTVFEVIGKHSLQIYVSHVLITSAFRIVFTKWAGIHNTYVLLLLGLTVGTMVPLLIVRLGKKVKPINWLFRTPQRGDY